MQASIANRALFVAIQIATALPALIFAFGAAFLLYTAVTWLGDPATGTEKYRAFVVSFQPTGAVSQATGLSLEAVDFVFRLFLVVMLAAFATFFAQLGLLVNATMRGRPFSRTNARRLGWMGWSLVIAFGLCEGLAALLFADATLDQWAVIAMFTLLGLVFLMLARVFAHGVALAEDVEGTV